MVRLGLVFDAGVIFKGWGYSILLRIVIFEVAGIMKSQRAFIFVIRKNKGVTMALH